MSVKRIRTESIPSPWTPSNQGRLEDSHGFRRISEDFEAECRATDFNGVHPLPLGPPPIKEDSKIPMDFVGLPRISRSSVIPMDRMIDASNHRSFEASKLGCWVVGGGRLGGWDEGRGYVVVVPHARRSGEVGGYI